MPRWLPNAISSLRIALVPAWLLLAFAASAAGDHQPLALLAVLVLLGVSDIVDGVLARRYGLATNFGATLDAVADKLAQVVTVTFLTWIRVPGITALPPWLFWALLLRDLLLSAGWLAVWRRRGEVLAEHRWYGKAASLALFIVVFASIAGAPRAFVDLTSALAVALVLIGTAGYLTFGWHQLDGSFTGGRPRMER